MKRQTLDPEKVHEDIDYWIKWNRMIDEIEKPKAKTKKKKNDNTPTIFD